MGNWSYGPKLLEVNYRKLATEFNSLISLFCYFFIFRIPMSPMGEVYLVSLSSGLILLHTLSIIATDCLMPTENESPKRITDDGNVPDRADLFTIASIDARPIIPLIPGTTTVLAMSQSCLHLFSLWNISFPHLTVVMFCSFIEVPIITCIHAYIPGYDPYNGIIQQTVLDGPRYIIAGCISGEVIVFKWNSDAVTLPPLETKEFMKRQTRRSFVSNLWFVIVRCLCSSIRNIYPTVCFMDPSLLTDDYLLYHCTRRQSTLKKAWSTSSHQLHNYECCFHLVLPVYLAFYDIPRTSQLCMSQQSNWQEMMKNYEVNLNVSNLDYWVVLDYDLNENHQRNYQLNLQQMRVQSQRIYVGCSLEIAMAQCRASNCQVVEFCPRHMLQERNRDRAMYVCHTLLLLIIPCNPYLLQP